MTRRRAGEWDQDWEALPGPRPRDLLHTVSGQPLEGLDRPPQMGALWEQTRPSLTGENKGKSPGCCSLGGALLPAGGWGS